VHRARFCVVVFFVVLFLRKVVYSRVAWWWWWWCAGKLVVLDGVHRLRNDTLGVLYQLIHDRELQLFDGSRLVSPDRFAALQDTMSEQELAAARIQPVHPAFRVLALGTPPTPQNPWLTAELLGLFAFHGVPTALPEVRCLLLAGAITLVALNDLQLLHVCHPVCARVCACM